MPFQAEMHFIAGKVLRETDKAVRVGHDEDNAIWIPKSVLHDATCDDRQHEMFEGETRPEGVYVDRWWWEKQEEAA